MIQWHWGLKNPIIMPELKSQKYHLVELPPKLDEAQALDFIEKSFASCLKKQQDHLILDISQVNDFERGYTNLLTKWIRNLKSLSGSLILTGVDEDKHSMLKTTRLTSLCDVYKSLEEFKRNNESASVFSHEEGEKITIEESPAAGNIYAKEEPAKAIANEIEEEGQSEDIDEELPDSNDDAVLEEIEKEISELEDLDALDEGQVTQEEDNKTESEPIEELELAPENYGSLDKSAQEENLGSEEPAADGEEKKTNSITEKIDIRKLEELNKDSDVSDKLDFLNKEDGELIEESVSHEAVENREEVEENLEVSEERSSDSFYNIMGDSADRDLDLASNMLEELDDVSVDEDLFSEEESEEVEEDSIEANRSLESANLAEENPDKTDLSNQATETADDLDGDEEEQQTDPLNQNNSEETTREDQGNTEEEKFEGPATEESETSEVRTTESYYNLMGDTAESGVDEDLLGSLDSVEVDPELFEEEGEGADVVSQAKTPSNKSQEKLEPSSSTAVAQKESPQAEDVLDDEEEFLDVPVGEVSQIIDFSGEYQCLGCGELDYFLKGERFHVCNNSACEGKEDGWHLVCLIF